jgi:hypothetical protein
MSKLSIIVPIYKKSKELIIRCFNSIISQSIQDFECVITYDWDSDEIYEFLKEWCKKDKRFQISFSLIKTSLHMSRLRAFNIITGDYVVFLDADDFIDKTYYEDLIKELEENNADASPGNMRFFHINGKEEILLNNDLDVNSKESFIFFKHSFLKGIFNKKTYQLANEELQKLNYVIPYNEDYLEKIILFHYSNKIIKSQVISAYYWCAQNDSGSVVMGKTHLELFKKVFSTQLIHFLLKDFVNKNYENKVQDFEKWQKDELNNCYQNLSLTKTTKEEKENLLKLKNLSFTSIPKLIHYVWIGQEIPIRLENLIETWSINKDYAIIRWDESQFKNHKWVKSCLQYKKYELVSDYIRLWVIYNFGGIYFDTDNKCLRPLTEDLLEKDLIIGWENNGIVLGFNVIGAKIHNQHIKTLLDWYDNNEYTPELDKTVFKLNTVTGKVLNVDGNFTINKIGTNLLLPSIIAGEIKPFANEYFIAGHYAKFHEYQTTKNTYIQHIYKKDFQLKDFGFK